MAALSYERCLQCLHIIKLSLCGESLDIQPPLDFSICPYKLKHLSSCRTHSNRSCTTYQVRKASPNQPEDAKSPVLRYQQSTAPKGMYIIHG